MAISTPTASADVVRIAARAYERDRYLAALLAPTAVRDDLIALAAFAGEVGRIPAFVTEPMMGRIRLQWWRERLESKTSGGHPIATALIAAMARHALPVAALIGLIDAHEDSLDNRPFSDEAALCAYVDHIDGCQFAMAALICGRAADTALIQDAGRAYGLARVLIETPATLSHGRVLLPLSLISGTPAPDLQQMGVATAAVRERASAHLAAAAAPVGRLSRATRMPFLPLALVGPYLQACEHFAKAVDTAPEINPLARVWRILACSLTGRV
jgi:15-cis-phytoene synthase